MIEVLDNIPVTLEPERVIQRLRVRNQSQTIMEMVGELIDAVLPVARPKAIYALAGVDNQQEDTVDIDGVRFTSKVLRVNLDGINRVFPYVATCGREVDEIEVAPGDVLKAYSLDIIKMMVLGSAIKHLSEYLERRYRPGQMSHMNPGSLPDWPLDQQEQLFSVLGDVEAAVGVTLTEGMLMVPTKSSSGIYFPTEVRFESCQLCPREDCVGRRVPYDPALVEQYQTATP